MVTDSVRFTDSVQRVLCLQRGTITEWYYKDINCNYLKHQQPYLFISHCGDTEVEVWGLSQLPWQLGTLMGDYSGTILASGMNLDCYGNVTAITSISFSSYFVPEEPLCSLLVRKLRTVSAASERSCQEQHQMGFPSLENTSHQGTIHSGLSLSLGRS